MTNVVRITGNFDLNRLEKAFGALIRRHEALRTAFRIADGEVVQTVQSDVPGIVTVKQVETEEEIRHYLKAFIRPFHLLSAPLARLEVLAAGTEQFILCFDIHHIVSDAVSLSILTKELSSLYNGERLEPVRIHFKDYAYVRGKQCEHNEMAADLEYWDAKLNRPAISFELQTDFPRGPIREFAGDTVTLDVSGDVNRGLFRLAHQSGGTLFMSLFAAFHILLMRVSGYEDVIVGTPIALRDQPALEGLVGNLVNVVPVRTRPVPEDTFNGFLPDLGVKCCNPLSIRSCTMMRWYPYGMHRVTSAAILYSMLCLPCKIFRYPKLPSGVCRPIRTGMRIRIPNMTLR